MAFIQCRCFSEVLGRQVEIWVLLPQATGAGQIGMAGKVSGDRHRTLFLLHGLSDDHTIWMRRTSIERYVAPHGLAVVMPDASRSFYSDMHNGGPRYWTYISEELPELCRQFFPLSRKREDTFVAGLSMGGYGAFKLALSCPDRFAGGASLSGALDMAARNDPDMPDISADLRLIFDDDHAPSGGDGDLFALAQKCLSSGHPVPRLYSWCGTGDFLYRSNLRFRDHAASIGLPLEYHQSDGDHQWCYWDDQIQKVISFFLFGESTQ